jgi:hypothetical protein
VNERDGAARNGQVARAERDVRRIPVAIARNLRQRVNGCAGVVGEVGLRRREGILQVRIKFPRTKVPGN